LAFIAARNSAETRRFNLTARRVSRRVRRSKEKTIIRQSRRNYGTHSMKNRRIIILFSLLALLASGLVSSASAQTKTPPKAKDKPLPNLILNTIDGQKWSLYENRRRVVLLNFWAT